MRVDLMKLDDLPELMTAGQEREMAMRIEAGVLAAAVLDGDLPWPGDADRDELRELVRLGEQAWQHFLLANARLVAHHAAAAARRSRVPLEEFFQEGFLGLAEALRRYDTTKGVRFSTYAVPWVRNAVLQHLALRGGSREGTAWQARQARNLRLLREHLEGERGHEIGVEELARAAGRDVPWTSRHLVDQQTVSLESTEVGLAAPCPRAQAAFDQCEQTPPDWLLLLESPDRRVVELRYGFADGRQWSHQEIAERMGISQSTVRRMESRALAVGREMLTTEESALAAA